jgi:hypothetical protein
MSAAFSRRMLDTPHCCECCDKRCAEASWRSSAPSADAELRGLLLAGGEALAIQCQDLGVGAGGVKEGGVLDLAALARAQASLLCRFAPDQVALRDQGLALQSASLLVDQAKLALQDGAAACLDDLFLPAPVG